MTQVLRRTAVLVVLAICGFVTGTVLMDVALAQVEAQTISVSKDTQIKSIVIRCTKEQAPCTFNVDIVSDAGKER